MAREKLSEVFPESVRRLAEKVDAPMPSWYAGQLHARGGDNNGHAQQPSPAPTPQAPTPEQP